MDSPNSTTTIVRANGREQGLFAEIFRLPDRYRHAIGLVDGESKSSVISSVEGSSDDLWPKSPAIQQYHKQDIDNDPALLGVGMSGKGHYSVSMLLKEHSDELEFRVEFACLVESDDSPMPPLVTTYRIEPEIEYRAVDDGICFSINTINARFESLPNTCLKLPPGPTFELMPRSIENNKATQWGYVIRLNRPK